MGKKAVPKKAATKPKAKAAASKPQVKAKAADKPKAKPKPKTVVKPAAKTDKNAATEDKSDENVTITPAASIGEGKPKRNRKMTEKQKELMLSKMQKSSPKKKPTKADTIKDDKADETDKMEDSIIERMHAVFNQETESNTTTDDNVDNDKPIKNNTLPEENIDEIRASLDSMPPPIIEENQITATLNLVVPDSLHSEADDTEAVTVDTVREEKNESIDTVASESTGASSATVVKSVKVIRVVNDDHVNFINDITRTETDLKEERKQEAKKKKELDMDSLEENLRLMHPEENEQVEAVTNPKPEAAVKEPVMQLKVPVDQAIQPADQPAEPLNVQPTKPVSVIVQPSKPVKLSYAELKLKVESLEIKNEELSFKNLNLEEVARTNAEKVLELQKNPSITEITDVLQKLEKTSKENQNLKEKLERKSGFKKKLNSLKEQYDKDKSKWADEIKHLEKKNSELKSDLDKKHSSDKESPKKDNDKDKKHSSDKATPKKDNDDNSNLNATIISMKVEKEKLTDQVARLKSSSISKDKKINGFSSEISKLKDTIKNLEQASQTSSYMKEQNNVLERVNKTNSEKIKKLESELAQSNQHHKEVVALRRENHEKNLALQENHAQITNMDAKIRSLMAENETLQKKLDQVISEKNKSEEERKKTDAEIARLMKENIKLLEEKKSLISGNKGNLELEMAYKACKEMNEKYIERLKYCKENHQQKFSNVTDPVLSALSRPVASSTPLLLPPPGPLKPSSALPLPQIRDIPASGEDDAPYDPENNVETIYFNNSRDTNQPALAVKASATATATKVAARGAVINPLDISGISDLVPPPPRIRDPSEEPSGTSNTQIMSKPSTSQGIRVANTATLRDPRQRKALSEAKDKPADNETNFKQAGHDRSIGSEAPIVPRSYTPAKYLPMVAQPDLSISEQDDEGSYDNPSPGDEGSGPSKGNESVIEQFNKMYEELSQQATKDMKEDVDESIVILSEKNIRPTDKQDRKRRHSSSSSSRQSVDTKQNIRSREVKKERRDSRSRSKSRSRRSNSRRRRSSSRGRRSSSRGRRSSSRGRRSKSRGRRSTSRTSSGRSKKRSSRERSHSRSRTSRRQSKSRKSRSKSSHRRRSRSRDSKSRKRSRSRSKSSSRSKRSNNSRRRSRSKRSNSRSPKRRLSSRSPKRERHSSRNSNENIKKEAGNERLNSEDTYRSVKPEKQIIIENTQIEDIPLPSVQASGSAGIRLFDAASRLQNLHSLQDAAYQQHVPLTVINSLPHLAAPILFPPAAAIVTTSTTSFNLDTRLPDPGFSPKKFPQDKTNEKFAIDLHKFMYATGDERNKSGDAGGEARKTALGGSKKLPKPVSSTYKSDDKGGPSLKIQDVGENWRYYLAPDIHPSASTVQWKNNCKYCGAFFTIPQEHFIDSKCRNILDMEKNGIQIECKMCNGTSHLVEACPFLCSFCYKCWCWSHTDSMHDKSSPQFILYLKRMYNANRQSFHHNSGDSRPHFMPPNLYANNLCKYQGSVKALSFLADQLLPDGLFQPWLHPEWNKCKFKGF